MRRTTSKLAVLAVTLLLAIVASGCGSSADGVRAASSTSTTSSDRVVAESTGKPTQVALAPIMHTVAAGEHLSTIATQYQVTWQRLFDANPTLLFADGHTVPFDNQDQLTTGASLRIPYYWETFAPRQPHVDPPVVKLKTKLVSYSHAAQAASADAPPPQSSHLSGDPSDADFDRLAQCESGGRWNLNSGNGYYGGLQFSADTWTSHGGQGLPHDSPREVQIEIARRTWRSGGWGQWPKCSRQLGFRK